MPSVFNHENACWGVKRSFCKVSQYDLSEEIHRSGLKTTDLGVIPILSSPELSKPTSNPIHYSVSSNGYYGYHPHTVIQDQKNENGMDVDENEETFITVYPGNGNISPELLGCHNLESYPHSEIPRRKRPLKKDCMDSSKRLRKEEPTAAELTDSDHEPHQCGDGSRWKLRRCCSSRRGLNEVDYETTTQLLRQTHGCELYLYERSCDY